MKPDIHVIFNAVIPSKDFSSLITFLGTIPWKEKEQNPSKNSSGEEKITQETSFVTL